MTFRLSTTWNHWPIHSLCNELHNHFTQGGYLRNGIKLRSLNDNWHLWTCSSEPVIHLTTCNWSELPRRGKYEQGYSRSVCASDVDHVWLLCEQKNHRILAFQQHICFLELHRGHMTMTACKRHGALNLQQLSCLFTSLLKLKTNEISTLRITGPLWREIIDDL